MRVNTFRFFQLLDDALLFELRQILDEHQALQMVHLMLNTHCQQTIDFDLEGFAVLIQCAHPYPFGTRDFFEYAGNAETAFLKLGFAATLQDFRVDQHQKLVFGFRNVDHN